MPPVVSTSPAQQRWRVVFRRDSASAGIGGRDLQATIEANLAVSGVPTAGRTQLAAGLPSGLACERELLDIVLTERWPVSRARAAFAEALPPGHGLVECYDVWLGERALAAQARGAEYSIGLDAPAPPHALLRRGTLALLGADRLIRTRTKGDRTVEYDLRALLDDIRVEGEGSRVGLTISVRIDPERGTVRPDEVVEALAEACGALPLQIAAVTRTRIILAGDAAGLKLD